MKKWSPSSIHHVQGFSRFRPLFGTHHPDYCCTNISPKPVPLCVALFLVVVKFQCNRQEEANLMCAIRAGQHLQSIVLLVQVTCHRLLVQVTALP